MTCEDCLSALATASLREMTPDSAVMQHCATCPDCARVTTMLREKEYETATVLNSLPPMSNPLTVAENALGIARRRRLGGIVVMMTGAALVATIWIVAATLVIPALNRSDVRIASELRTETMPLSCLSPQQAADIINPYVRKRGSTYYIPSSGIAAITVRGTPDELAKSRDLIAHFERDPSAACHVTEGSLLKPGTIFQGGGDMNYTPTPQGENLGPHGEIVAPQGENMGVFVTPTRKVPVPKK